MIPTSIPYGRQTISPEDIEAVLAVLKSDFLTQGPAIPHFEQRLSSLCRGADSVVVNSATSGLHLACMALNIGPGDTVWTSPNTFVASANCARYCGASVGFVDIDPISFNLCPNRLESELLKASHSNSLPKVVIPVHFAGQPCDMGAIHDLQRRFEFHLIEDASHAVGATYGPTVVGDGTFSDFTIFSFHPVKIVTSGEGGAIMTRSASYARSLRMLRSHGITRDPSELIDQTQGMWYYEQHELGYNYRMTDIQAALGASQLQRIEAMIERRHQIADRYDTELSGLELDLPLRLPGRRSAMHLYCIQVPDRRRVYDALREQGLGVNVHYIPVHLQPYYRKLGFRPGDFPVSESFYRSALSIPMYSGLCDEDQSKVIRAIQGVIPCR